MLWPSHVGRFLEYFGRVTLAEYEWYGRVALAESENTLAESEWPNPMHWLLQSEILLTNQPRLVRGVSGASAHARRG